MDSRPRRAGDTIEDHCRVCKLDRHHSVIVVDGAGQPLRTQCDYCGSQHNFRGPEVDRPASAASGRADTRSDKPLGAVAPRPALDLVADRECATLEQEGEAVPVSAADLERLLRRIVREEAGVSAVVPADKWRGGSLVLKPGVPGLQEKSWPIETFFHKIVMIRNRLRTLEQQVNASDLPDEVKVKLQTYVTGCYGSLTSFNVLFADEDDMFRGAGE
jgi:hypothetical protein